MRTRREALRRTFSWSGCRRSLIVAILVGTILNLINQGPELFDGGEPVIWKLALTYLVPFLVASYGSYAAFRSSADQSTSQPWPTPDVETEKSVVP